MNNQIPHGISFGCEKINIVQLPEEFFLNLSLEPEDRDFLLKHLQKLLVFIGKPRYMFRHVELNNQPLAGGASGIFRFVQNIGWDTYDVKSLHLVRNTLNKMNCAWTQQNTQFVKGVEVLELHIDIRASHIVVEIVENGIIFFVDTDTVFILIERKILNQHGKSPR